jgi:NAD(P)-dependent dehydrogenase (short-subunit alcohol dehydrogenase family)
LEQADTAYQEELDMKPLQGKAALVTGGSRGVGKAIAVELATLGADVAVTARTVQPRGDDLPGTVGESAAAIEALGSRSLAIAADLSRPPDVDRVVTEVLDTFGRVDILVNNAADTGDNVFRGFWETTADEWATQVQVNLNAMYTLMKGCAPGMRSSGGGLIVNLGSFRAVPEGITETGEIAAGITLGAAYPTTKVAIFAMTTLLASELARDGITAVTLGPGAAASEMFLHQAKKMGWDADAMTTPLAWPAKTVGYLATCDDPRSYAGTYVDAVAFAAENGLT